MLKLIMMPKPETQTCYRFMRADDGEPITLYLKKGDVAAAGIDPTKNITLTVEGEPG